MSELTLDEAIKHCLEVAEKNEDDADVYDVLAKNHNNTYSKLTAIKYATDCVKCAADHRQLAEWLMEYKDLKAEQNDQYVFIHELMSELKEAKRLLKAAVEDINAAEACDTCEYYPVINSAECQKDDCYKWRYADEAEKLLNDEK